ncbi:hypothetical protein [Alteribacillus sp. HJP-4]
MVLISSLLADAFRGACLQLIQPQRSFGRMDFQTLLNPVGVAAFRSSI